MAASTALTTLTKVKSYLGITGTGDDTLLNTFIADAGALIEKWCDREFLFGQKTEYFDGGSGETPDGHILVKSPPIQTSAGAEVRTQTQIDASITVRDDVNHAWGAATGLATTSMEVDAEAGLIHVFAELTEGIKNIKVTYYGGYAADAVPTEVDMACQIVVAYLYNQAKSGADGFKRESEAGLSATYDDDFIPQKAQVHLADFVRGGL